MYYQTNMLKKTNTTIHFEVIQLEVCIKNIGTLIPKCWVLEYIEKIQRKLCKNFVSCISDVGEYWGPFREKWE